MPAPTVVILAAGEGTRMRSATPKMLHRLCGRELILWPIAAAQQAGAGKIVVVDGPRNALEDHLPDGVQTATQHEPNGTGDAVKAAVDHIDDDATVVILMGDVPLVSAAFIAELTQAHEANRAAATMATMILDDPGSYGRVVRTGDNEVERVVEAKKDADASPEQLAIKEVNTGIYCFAGGPLKQALDAITPDNAQGEYYLPDALPALRGNGHSVQAHVVDDYAITLGINDRVDLARVHEIAQRRILEDHMRNGVTVVQPQSTLVDAGIEIGADTVIEPGTTVRGGTRIGANATIGPQTTLIDATVGDNSTVIHSFVNGATIGADAIVGPFAYLRPGTHLHDGAKAGTFVEIKNSEIGAGAKVPHLSYIGDADIGEKANIGAGTITANYDGHSKHRTTIGARAHVSVDTSFVAPVRVGEDAFTGAGSVITDDIPPKALGIARQRQTNIDGYADRKPPKDRG